VKRANYGFSETRLLPGKTGYVKIDFFHDQEGALQAAAKALASVADSGALIFDLREHSGGGGDVGTFILSYFLSRPTLVSTLYDRDGRKAREFRTLADIPVPATAALDAAMEDAEKRLNQ
jgi:C-terminal processing protease CtpA/Prc